MLKQLSIIINYDRCLKAFLFLSPIVWLPGITQNSLQMLMLDYGALILFGLSFTLVPEREFKNYNLLLIFSLCILIALFKNFTAYPIHFIHLIAGCLLYISIVRSAKDIQGILKIFTIIAVVNIVFFIFQFGGFNLVYSLSEQDKWLSNLMGYSGLMGRNYHLGYFLAIAIPFMLKQGKPGYMIAGLSMLAIILTKSVACIGAMFFAIGAYIVFNVIPKIRKHIIIIIVFLAVVLIVVNYKLLWDKFQCRIEPMRYILQEALINPFVGNGIGSFEADINLYGASPKFISSFNQYARLIYELGIVPFIAICLGLWKYFSKIYIKVPAFLASFTAIAIYPMFHEVLRFARFDIIIIAIVALYEASCLDKREENEPCCV